MPEANTTSCDLFLKSKAKAQLQSPAGGAARDAVRCAPIDEVWTSGRPGAELSPDGKWLAVVEAEALRVVDLSSGEEAFSLPRPSVRALAFSPRGTYLLTWEKLSEGVAENLRLWRTADGAFVCGWAQKLLGEKWQWPALRWAADESFFARAVSNEVHCFDGAAPSQTVAQRLRVPGVSNFAIAPAGSPPLVATFVPEGKGAPATVRLWRHGDYGEGRFLASKTFFKAAEAQLKFSPDGQALLVRTHVDVDTGGKSYDGASGLMHMDASGDASVMRLPKEGPIHDVQWAPDSSEFLALFGFSPPRACLFSGGKGHKVLHDFGDDARNTVCWAPHGRSFILAGFGNLGGELSFWDRKTLRCLSTVDAHMTVAFEWSPDSRAFLTAVLWPRLRVENGVKLWSPSGALLQHQPHDELTIAAWRPSPLAAFDPPGEDCFVARPSAAAKPPPKKYVPPGARGGGAAGGGGKKSLAELAAAYEGGGSAALRSGPVVGAGEEEGAAGSRNAAKQKAKREAARRKKEAEAAGGGGGGGAAAAAPEAGGAPPKAEGGGEDNSADKLLKKIRGVEKKLRQIGELRELQAGGKPLEKNQLDKISGEGEVRAELEALKLKHCEAEAKEQAAAKEGSWR